MGIPKRIVLGVCGGIAAYKSVFLLRLLQKSGADVRVVMTPSASDFITPLTFSAISGNEVLSKFSKDDGTWNNHVHLANWADHILIAPGTANTIAKLARGQCDNLLLATCMSASCPVTIAPAMDREMWKHEATQTNIEVLKGFGYNVLPVGVGELASGLEGEGRMAEPEEILKTLKGSSKKKSGKRLKVLVTAGPTHEPIDDVRFIGNHSSGKMGIAIANAFEERGAEVTLVIGPSPYRPLNGITHIIDVQTAQEMLDACEESFDSADVIVAAAAVADFTPKERISGKRKKSQGLERIDLEPTADILKTMGEKKSKDQTVVGFALETDDELANAEQKLKSKNLDLIVLNSLQDEGAGFGHDTNKVTLIWKDNKVANFELMPKVELARKLADSILKYHNA